MKSTYSLKEAQSRFAGIVHEAETGGMATIARHEKAVAYIMGADDLASMVETMELLANPAARKAVADAEAGKGRVIECVFAEERSLVYHLFAREMLEHLRHELNRRRVGTADGVRWPRRAMASSWAR